ncbi:hypothetical protein T03_12471 [Trichinella britovi]|uniref:Uncharacterized protein n=1 Tax=Trichinella britovi TaxID=45882 RepID=A0A0V1C830_TRIBR|nr:hypothetical protein T03_12471 [Trichinella britovi]
MQPEATPRAKFQKISKFSKNCLRHSPGRSLRADKNLHITLRRLKICIKTPSVKAPGFTLRLCPRANKNLHMPSGYPPGNL